MSPFPMPSRNLPSSTRKIACFAASATRPVPTGAVDYFQQPEDFTIAAQAAVLATGYGVTPLADKPQFGAGRLANVITALQMERLLAPHGPYNRVLRPSDGKLPDSIAYLQCAASRDQTMGIPYCSRVCCMYAIKQAMLLSGSLPLADITIYYLDIRAFGKGYEQFFQNASAMGVQFVKAKPVITGNSEDGGVMVRYEAQEEDGRIVTARARYGGAFPGAGPRLGPGRPLCGGDRRGRLYSGHQAQDFPHPDGNGGRLCGRRRFRAEGYRGRHRRGRGGGHGSCQLPDHGHPGGGMIAKMTEKTNLAGDQANPKPPTAAAPKVGVYVCHCGGNISDQVDVEKVCGRLRRVTGVVTAKSSQFMCSDPGQELIIEDLKSGAVDRVVVASCAPSLHEATFRHAIARAGANPYLYEHANIREQVSWVHHGPDATEKAIRLTAAATAKARQLTPLDPIRLEAVKHATVVGGGVAGLKAALDLARRGLPVTLIEKSAFLGGQTAQLDRLAPTGEKAAEVVAELGNAVLQHPGITVHTCAEIAAFQGYIGNFKIVVRREPPGAGAGEVAHRVGVYPGGVPEMAEEFTFDTGAIVLATGFRPYRPRRGEYGFGEFPEVVTLPELIRLLAEDTPRRGHLELHGRKIRSVALVHCVGSRMIPGIHPEDEEGRLNEYCSRTCCTASLQAANLIRQTYPDTSVFELYRDIRTYGRGQEDLYLEACRNGVTFLRFRADESPLVERSARGGYPLLVRVKDQLLFGEELEVPADLVVLAVGMEPNDISGLIELMKLPVGEDRFLQEVHPKLRPVELAVAGILLAGTCQAPMDVGEACAAASAAAVKAATILSRGYVELDPFVAEVDLEKCRGTGECVAACRQPGALALAEMTVAGEKVLRGQVNPALCSGCGACVAVCPEGAINVKGWTLGHYEAMVDAIVSDEILEQE